MKKIIVIALVFLIHTSAYAALTVGNVPKTKTGGTAPALENSAITDSSGNIGINSTHPGKKLDVVGTIRAIAFFGDGSNLTGVSGGSVAGSDTHVQFNDAGTQAGNAGFVFQKTTGTVTAIHFVGDGAGLTGIGGSISGLTTNKLTKANSSTTIGDSQIFDNGTNIGIGSLVPGKKLDIIGTVRATAFIGDGSGLTGTGGWTTDASTKTTTTYNVGVGSINPTQILDVTGNINSTGYIQSAGSGDSYFSGQNVGIGTFAPIVAKLAVKGNAAYGSSYAISLLSPPTDGVVIQGNVGIGTNNPVTLLDVNRKLNVASAGNVSIGTITALSKLHIQQGLTTNTPLAGTALILENNAGNYLTFLTDAGQSNTQGILFTDGAANFPGSVLYKHSTDTLTLSAGSQSQLQLLPDGNIGIGSVTPGKKLDVTGTVRADYFVGDGSGITGLSGSISGLTTNKISKATSSTTIGDSQIFDNATNVGIGTIVPVSLFDVNRKFNIFSGGNIGIGSITPGKLLDVAGKSRSNNVPTVTIAADATSITPNSDNAKITQQTNTQSTGTLTINADGGTPDNGQSWELTIKSTNVQTFSWNSIFVGGTIALPTVTTGSSKIDHFTFQYCTIDSKWHYTGTGGGY